MCIEDLVRGVKTFEDFDADEKTKRAVAMTMINIGELVHVLSVDFKDSVPEIPFNAIKATRNIIAHEYRALDFRVIWNTVKISIPELKAKLKNLVK